MLAGSKRMNYLWSQFVDYHY